MNTSLTISIGAETLVIDEGGIELISSEETSGWYSWDEISRIVVVGDGFRWVMEPRGNES